MMIPKNALPISLLLACLSLNFLCTNWLSAAAPSTIYVYDMDQGGDSEREMMASLAGVVARTSADVALGYKISNFTADPEFWVDQHIAHNPGTSKVWRGWEEWFIDAYKGDLSGYVVYDADSINQATSVAGALGSLMVHESLLGGSIGTALSNAGLTQLEDVRGRSSFSVYNEYRSLFNKDKIFRQAPTLSHQLRSYAVKEGGFVFDKTGWQRDYYLSRQNDHSMVYGWGPNGSEYDFFSSASENNLMAVPADHLQSAGPFSAWDTNIPQQQPGHTPTDIPAEAGKHYVAFVMSDGDNAQWLTNIFREDRWFGSPHRGEFDFTFDLTPDLLNVNPAALQYLYEQAAVGANKTFFVSPGGQGLTYPSLVPDVEGLMDASVAAMKAVDHNIISVLDDGPGAPDFTAYNQMVAYDEVMGLMLKTGPAYTGLDGAISWHNGKPIVSTKYTLWDGFDTPDDVIAGLNSAPTDPFNDQGSFTIVNVNPWATDTAGGGTGNPMANISYIMENLNSSVELVTLEGLMIHLRNNFGAAVAPTLLAPGDAIIAIDADGDSAYPAGESAANVIDGTLDKYLNSGEENSGFIVTPAVGESFVEGFQVITANDFEERDPTDWQLFGTNDTITSADNSDGTDENWVLIDGGSLTLPSARDTYVPLVEIDNNTESYRSYKMIFTDLKIPGSADSIQIAELQFFGEVAGLPGDFDGDNDVDGADFLSWQRGFGMLTDAEVSDGDANFDGKVDAEDLRLWQANYGSQTASFAATPAVPEPGTLGMSLAIATSFVLRRRRTMLSLPH